MGVDCSQNFIDLATREAAEESVKNASFFVADAQCDDLGGPYDHVFSRFGTMFFNLPGFALRNIRRALIPGGELTMIVWRRREDNAWVHEAERRVREIVPVVAHEDTDEVHCGPGPFSLSGPDMVSDMLRSAGYEHIAFARYDTDICIGRNLDEAVEFALALGPAGEIIRLAGEAGELLRGAGHRRAARDPFRLSAQRRHLDRLEHLVRHRQESRGLTNSYRLRRVSETQPSPFPVPSRKELKS